MVGFLVRVLSLEQRRNNKMNLIVQGAERFKVSRLYKDEPAPEEEAKRQGETLWIAEGQALHDVNRIELIERSEQLEEAKKVEYTRAYEVDLKQKLCRMMEEFQVQHFAKCDQEMALIDGGRRERR